MAVVAVIVLLLVVGMVIAGMVLGTGRDQDLSVRRFESVEAFYAAEGAMNMAIRETLMCRDEDGDGDVGTISDDSNDATDPVIGNAQAAVTLASNCPISPTVTLTSRGRAGIATRVARLTLEQR